MNTRHGLETLEAKRWVVTEQALRGEYQVLGAEHKKRVGLGDLHTVASLVGEQAPKSKSQILRAKPQRPEDSNQQAAGKETVRRPGEDPAFTEGQSSDGRSALKVSVGRREARDTIICFMSHPNQNLFSSKTERISENTERLAFWFK